MGGHARQRYGLLLAVLTVSFAIQGTAPATDGWRAAVTLLLGWSLLLAFRSADMPPRRLRIAGLLVAAVVGAAIGAFLARDSGLGTGLATVADAVLVALGPAASVVGGGGIPGARRAGQRAPPFTRR